MRAEHDLELPRLLQIEFSRVVQGEVDASNAEITAEQLIKLFRREYMGHPDAVLVDHAVTSNDKDHSSALDATLRCGAELVPIVGEGNGTIAAFANAIEHLLDVTIKVRDYQQQTLSDGTDAKAISYVKLSVGDDTAWGVGEDTDTAKANFDAVLSAVTRIPGALNGLPGRVSSDGGQKASSPVKP
jgi:2-isopropylmalate synthase